MHTCFLLRTSYPIRPSLPSLPPCLAQLCCATAALGGFSVGALSVSCPCFSSDLGSERSSLRSRGILLYPLCHKAFEPVDNFVFSVDIYRYCVYNYPYLHSYYPSILSVLSIYYLPMKVFYCYPCRYSLCYPYCSSPCSSFLSLGNGYLQERASLAIQQRTLRLYRSLRARYSLRVLSYLPRAISLLPAFLRNSAYASFAQEPQPQLRCNTSAYVLLIDPYRRILPQRLTFPTSWLCFSSPDCSSFQSSQSLAKKDSGFAYATPYLLPRFANAALGSLGLWPRGTSPRLRSATCTRAGISGRCSLTAFQTGRFGVVADTEGTRNRPSCRNDIIAPRFHAVKCARLFLIPAGRGLRAPLNPAASPRERADGRR